MLGVSHRGQQSTPVVDGFWPVVPDTEYCGEGVARGNGAAVSVPAASEARQIDLSKLDVAAMEGEA